MRDFAWLRMAVCVGGTWLAMAISPMLAAQTPPENASIMAATPTPEALVRGKRVFNLQCRACHSLAADEAHKVGPNLSGMLARPAGTAAGFKYSAPLKASVIQWNAQTLDQWLQKPSAMVGGTTMAYEGLAAEKDRAAVVVYLLAATSVPKP